MQVYDVIIVGAGPVGLATAIGLYQQGITNILVLDQTRSFRQVGHVVDLLPNGLKALKSIDNRAYEVVKNTGVTFSNTPTTNNQGEKPNDNAPKWLYKNLQGDTIRAISLSFDRWFAEYGEGRISIAWYDLQTALRQLLPPEQVWANHRCIHVAEQPEMDCVRVDCVCDVGASENPYAHWQEMTSVENPSNNFTQSINKSFMGKLVVAADGINSTIRRVIYENTPHVAFAKPDYSGFAAITCRDMELPQELTTQIQTKYLDTGRVVTIIGDRISENTPNNEVPRMMLFRRPETGKFGYIIHAALPEESLRNKSGSELMELALETLEKANFPDILRQLVRLSPPENIQQRPYYIHLAAPTLQPPNTDEQSMESSWSQGRIVLVGDAAHGMPPFMAQGTNQGFADALVIVNLIGNLQLDDSQQITTAWEKYEQLRRPAMIYVQKATLNPLIYSSQEDLQAYNQRVYHQDFAQLIEQLDNLQ